MTDDPTTFALAGKTLLAVGEPVSQEAFEFALWLMTELEEIRLIVGGDGHDNMAERVSWAIRQARGEKPH
jgi:hypothetical protein